MHNKILIFGKHAVLAALNNPKRKLLALYLLHERKKEYLNLLPKRSLSVLNICEVKQISKLCPKDAVHQGIALLTERLMHPSLKEICATLPEKTLILILDKITDPANFGNIIRSAKAFGVSFILTQERNSPSENPVVAKTSSGALENVPICTVPNIAASIRFLKEEGFFCYALDGHTKNSILDETFHRRTAFVLGSEGNGISQVIKNSCDRILKIPMHQSDDFDSINVTNAAAIALFSFYKSVHN